MKLTLLALPLTSSDSSLTDIDIVPGTPQHHKEFAEVTLHTPEDTPVTKMVKKSLHSKIRRLQVIHFLWFSFVCILCNCSLSLSCVTLLLNIFLLWFSFYISGDVVCLWSCWGLHLNHALMSVTRPTASWTQLCCSSMSLLIISSSWLHDSTQSNYHMAMSWL